MAGDGPILWLSDARPDPGFWRLPPNGMCVSAFLFVTKGELSLLGKYADDPRWTALTGLDQERYRATSHAEALPALGRA